MRIFRLVRGGAIVIATVLPMAGMAAEERAATPYHVSADADGVQRVALIGGSYFFRPAHVVAQAGQPLEVSVKVERGIVPHSFVLESHDGKRVAEVSLGEEPKILRFTLPPGEYAYYCPKRLLGFKSHRERGMAGILEVRE